MENKGMIYELIGKAIGRIGAIGKDKKNAQQGFMYRGIDQVYNALNPVMAELGIFFCPEVLDQKREERQTKNGSVLTYTILTMKFTAYAPDGSNVSMVVVGEGMDSGDKSSNKAMSVAMKYAMFQLFCIPTEEMKDPDADVYDDVLPRGATRAPQMAPQAQVSTVATVPPTQGQAAAQPQQTPPAPNPNPLAGEAPGTFISRRIFEMKQEFPGFDFMKARTELIKEGKVPDVPSATLQMDQAKTLADAVYLWHSARKAS